MVLVSGAAGKTGRAVMAALLARGGRVRAMVRDAQQARSIEYLAVQEVVLGDMRAEADVRRAVRGVRAIYHICPNMHPQEEDIGRLFLQAAREEGVEHFVYHSVLHPQTEKMPHHWHKMRVEEMILESGLSFTILQPTAYMQNILAQRERILTEGRYLTPYSRHACISLVDLEDVAAAAATVLSTAEHVGATYELVGTRPLAQTEVADRLSAVLGVPVQAGETAVERWREGAIAAGLGSYQVETLLRMFAYYDAYGLAGNVNVLTWLLGRPPTTLDAFIRREFGGQR